MAARNLYREGFVVWKARAAACLAVLALASISARATAQKSQPSEKPPDDAPFAKRVRFAGGVQIDWAALTVEVGCKVVLRGGPLELLACSPRTREHESILVIPARPLHIYQAMGLVGLEPGSPVEYDRANQRWKPPSGTRLALAVRYEKDGAETIVPVERWLYDLRNKRMVASVDWVFAGSKYEEELFLADEDGTIACVVDFDTALIAVGSLHTASNEALWLRANTDAIPPVGTECTLLIRAAPGQPLVIDLEADGKLLLAGAEVSPEEAVRRAKGRSRGTEGVALVLRLAPGMSRDKTQAVIASFEASGLSARRIKIQNRETSAGKTRRDGQTSSKGGGDDDR